MCSTVDASWNVMAHAQKPDFVFRRNGRVHLNQRGASVQSTTGNRGVRISGSNVGYTMFRGSVKSTGYPLHSPVSPFICLPVRHRVPSHFSWTLQMSRDNLILAARGRDHCPFIVFSSQGKYTIIWLNWLRALAHAAVGAIVFFLCAFKKMRWSDHELRHIRPSAWNNSVPTGRIFTKNWYLKIFFLKISRENSTLIKIW
jgi:hypothetical protein